MATSVPAPMAIPTSAFARAGASFIPSPIIATQCPSSCNLLISFSLSSGSTWAITFGILSRFCIAFALSLSPVSITVEIPIFVNSSMAFLEVSFSTSATAIIPITLLSLAKIRGVLPSSARLLICGSIFEISILFSFIKALLPPKIVELPEVAFTPLPNTASKFSTLSEEILLSLQYFTIASARGCSLFFSREMA